MKIEAVQKASDHSLSGKPEVWVRVFSNEMHDWPRVEAKLTEAQSAILGDLGARTLTYLPHSPTADEREEHDYMFEDWYVWAAKG